MKIEIIKRESAIDETKFVFMVHVYDDTGELIDVTGFKSENLAKRYAFEMEQYDIVFISFYINSFISFRNWLHHYSLYSLS